MAGQDLADWTGTERASQDDGELCGEIGTYLRRMKCQSKQTALFLLIPYVN